MRFFNRIMIYIRYRLWGKLLSLMLAVKSKLASSFFDRVPRLTISEWSQKEMRGELASLNLRASFGQPLSEKERIRQSYLASVLGLKATAPRDQ